MSYILEKPCTEIERADFIVEYNHRQGLMIEEDETAIYALEAWELLVDDEVIDNTEEYEAEQAQKERERLNLLSMTRGDMFEAIILAFGKTKADIRSMIENVEGLTDIERALYLNRFDEALDFYRGYPAVDLIGQMLGVSSEQLDKFFETKDYKYLTTCTLTINATPTEATVTGDGSYPYGTTAHYKVELEGYKPYTGSIELLKDTELDIELEKIEEVVDENTTDTADIPNEVETEADTPEKADTDNFE